MPRGRPNAATLEGHLLIDAPLEGSIVVHSTFVPIRLCTLAGVVRVTASRARATILDTPGRVDAVASVIDFSGERGRVRLNAEIELNLQFPATTFDGTLDASAGGALRVLLAWDFHTPLRVRVRRRDHFVCRTPFRDVVIEERSGDRYVFTSRSDCKRIGTAEVVLDTI